MTVSFTHLPFDTITVDGVLEAFLGYTNQYLYGNVSLNARHFPEDGSQRKSRHRVAAATKESLYQAGADKMFAFLKLGVQCSWRSDVQSSCMIR